MNERKVIDVCRPFFNHILCRPYRMIGLVIAVLLIGEGDALAQNTGKNSSRVNRAESASRASQAPTLLSAEEVSEARRRLAELGMWVKAEGAADEVSLRHALIAFQKIEDRPRTGVLTADELQALRGAHRPVPRETGYPHVEIDLCRQVLLLVEAGEVSLRILPVSTGSGKCFTEGGRTRRAITPQGRFTVQRKIKGWRKSPLGLLYYPNYIYDGVAIHGNPSAPPQPASHGCIRIPMFAAREFSELATVGMVVIIYDSGDALSGVNKENLSGSRRIGM
jgi:N-acetylmuramoyl-L-alanine amidase